MSGSGASPSPTLGDLLTAFTFAGDLAFALEFEDGIRSCYLAVRIAEQMGLSEEERNATYYASLLKDAGCTSFTSQFAEFVQTANELVARRDAVIFGGIRPANVHAWMDRYVGSDLPPSSRASQVQYVAENADRFLQEAWASSFEVCTRVIKRLGLPEMVQEATLALGEQWDGHGLPAGLKGDEIPLIAQVVGPTFVLPPVHRTAGRDAAIELIREMRGEAFSPRVCDAFLSLAARASFWEEFESSAIYDVVLAMEPRGALAQVDNRRFDDLAEAFADFVDLKSPYFAAHSRRVGKIAEQIARLLRRSEEEVIRVRRAALMHDLGIVGVPSRILNKPSDRLSASEREVLRLHPYHGERIIDRVRAFDELKPLLGAHHEHMDGSGYYRGTRGRELPLDARIIVVANRLDELMHGGPDVRDLELTDALDHLGSEAGSMLDSEIVEMVRTALGGKQMPAPPRSWPAGLTDREVDVLRIASKGLTRKEVAEALGISENTVRHHLEHIYSKTGTTTRVGATLFAMENDLLT